MHYRCPLCLKLLERDDNVVKFCPVHPDAAQRPIAPYAPDERDGGFRCSVDRCKSHTVVRPDGLMYRHDGCTLEAAPGLRQPSTNPFWNGSAVQIEEYVDVGSGEQARREFVDHWQITVLRQLESVSRSEMWFPAALLPRVRDRRHVLVSLTGAKNAGKTYLAMRAVDPYAYEDTPRPSDDFFFIHQGAETRGDAGDFLRTLYLRQLLREQRPREFATLLAATVQRPRNLKVALFPESPPHPVPRLFDFWPLRDLIIDLDKSMGWLGHQPEASFRALMMYDLSGEAVERDRQDVLRLDSEMNVVAVLLSLEDLLSHTREAGLAATSDRLLRIGQVRTNSNPNLRACLVITKCDRLPRDRPGDENSLRALVLSLAEQKGERVLVEALAGAGTRDSPIDRVFFTAKVEDGQRDNVRGLGAFVRWCME